MSKGPQSWAASITIFTFVVLAAAFALNVAAELLREALPVLVPVGVAILIGMGLWRWHARSRGW